MGAEYKYRILIKTQANEWKPLTDFKALGIYALQHASSIMARFKGVTWKLVNLDLDKEGKEHVGIRK